MTHAAQQSLSDPATFPDSNHQTRDIGEHFQLVEHGGDWVAVFAARTFDDGDLAVFRKHGEVELAQGQVDRDQIGAQKRRLVRSGGQ